MGSSGDPSAAFAALIGSGVLAIVPVIAIAVAIIGIEIWIVYTIIWRAVRRGLREFHQGAPAPVARPGRAVPRPSAPGPRDWSPPTR